MLYQDIQYKLRLRATHFLKGAVIKAKVSSIQNNSATKAGTWGLANKKLPKIYILRYGKEIIYVGITKQKLSSRFRFGLSISKWPYKWMVLANKNESEDINLFVYLFENEERTEAIEAEIVYLIRKNTGKWPKYQMEIHFHHNASNEEKKIANKIYKQISKKYLN